MISNLHRLRPNYREAKLYSLRGVVESHGVKKTGWGRFSDLMSKILPFWVDEIFLVKIKINTEQLVRFNQLACATMTINTAGGNLLGITPVIEIGFQNQKPEEYPIGTEVGITFGYSGPIAQFLLGNEPLRVMKLQVIQDGVELENEI